MKRIILGILVVLSISLLGIAIAQAERAPATVVPSGRTVVVPDQAIDNSPVLERAIFIHYRKGFAKPPQARKGPSCYDLLGKEVEWKSLPVSYFVDPDNPDGLTKEFVANAIYQGAEEWDAHTSTELFGAYSIDNGLSWDSDAPDGRNELLFGNYPKEGVIGVTVVWGYFSGPLSTRKIIEFDVLFDTDFTWGDAASNPAVMDLQNIATHELGHGVGLDDVYETVCSEVTMYAYSDYGEAKKTTLEPQDITGIQKLYGK